VSEGHGGRGGGGGGISELNLLSTHSCHGNVTTLYLNYGGHGWNVIFLPLLKYHVKML